MAQNNALNDLLRQTAFELETKNIIGNQLRPLQPLNTVRVSSGEYITPQGTRSLQPVIWKGAGMQQTNAFGYPAAQDQNGNLTFYMPSGQKIYSTVAEMKALQDRERQNQLIENLPNLTKMEQLRGMRLENQQREAELRMPNASNKAPAGYRHTKEGNLEVIPGGPADVKAQQAMDKDTFVLASSVDSMDRLALAANEALNHPGLAGIAGIRGAIPNIPGSQAANAAATLEALKSQVAFSVLQEMRNNSKTGGALGAVSDKEMALLQANLAALQKSQSVEQLRSNLQKIIDYTDQAKGRFEGAFEMKYGGKQEQQPIAKSAMKQKGGTSPMRNAKGWTLHTDAQGNQAYVSPDGKQFEEVQ